MFNDVLRRAPPRWSSRRAPEKEIKRNIPQWCLRCSVPTIRFSLFAFRCFDVARSPLVPPLSPCSWNRLRARQPSFVLSFISQSQLLYNRTYLFFRGLFCPALFVPVTLLTCPLIVARDILVLMADGFRLYTWRS